VSGVQAAIDECATALRAVDWQALVGLSVVVDATPARVWTLDERRDHPIVYLFGGGQRFNLLNRDGLLLVQPTLYAATMFHLGSNDDGQLVAARLALAESIFTHMTRTIRDCLVRSARFAPALFDQPERFDPDQVLRADYVSTLAVTLQDNKAL
jgi:hypothetical protein